MRLWRRGGSIATYRAHYCRSPMQLSASPKTPKSNRSMFWDLIGWKILEAACKFPRLDEFVHQTRPPKCDYTILFSASAMAAAAYCWPHITRSSWLIFNHPITNRYWEKRGERHCFCNSVVFGNKAVRDNAGLNRTDRPRWSLAVVSISVRTRRKEFIEARFCQGGVWANATTPSSRPE